MEKLRIGLCGPSGSGKTTIAKFIESEFETVRVVGSAYTGMLPEFQKELQDKHDYQPKGHLDVIRKSFNRPDFGKDFQNLVLKSRERKLPTIEGNFVIDRTPIDNKVFSEFCCSAFDSDFVHWVHARANILLFSEFTHIIFVPYIYGNPVEDNGARVPSPSFQHMINRLFQHHVNACQEMDSATKGVMGLKFLTLDQWDLDWRKEQVKNFLNGEG